MSYYGSGTPAGRSRRGPALTFDPKNNGRDDVDDSDTPEPFRIRLLRGYGYALHIIMALLATAILAVLAFHVFRHQIKHTANTFSQSIYNRTHHRNDATSNNANTTTVDTSNASSVTAVTTPAASTPSTPPLTTTTTSLPPALTSTPASNQVGAEFAANAEIIRQHNALFADGNVTWALGVNDFSHLSLAQFANNVLMSATSSQELMRSIRTLPPLNADANTPSTSNNTRKSSVNAHHRQLLDETDSAASTDDLDNTPLPPRPVDPPPEPLPLPLSVMHTNTIPPPPTPPSEWSTHPAMSDGNEAETVDTSNTHNTESETANRTDNSESESVNGTHTDHAYSTQHDHRALNITSDVSGNSSKQIPQPPMHHNTQTRSSAPVIANMTMTNTTNNTATVDDTTHPHHHKSGNTSVSADTSITNNTSNVKLTNSTTSLASDNSSFNNNTTSNAAVNTVNIANATAANMTGTSDTISNVTNHHEHSHMDRVNVNATHTGNVTSNGTSTGVMMPTSLNTTTPTLLNTSMPTTPNTTTVTTPNTTSATTPDTTNMTTHDITTAAMPNTTTTTPNTTSVITPNTTASTSKSGGFDPSFFHAMPHVNPPQSTPPSQSNYASQHHPNNAPTTTLTTSAETSTPNSTSINNTTPVSSNSTVIPTMSVPIGEMRTPQPIEETQNSVSDNAETPTPPHKILQSVDSTSNHAATTNNTTNTSTIPNNTIDTNTVHNISNNTNANTTNANTTSNNSTNTGSIITGNHDQIGSLSLLHSIANNMTLTPVNTTVNSTLANVTSSDNSTHHHHHHDHESLDNNSSDHHGHHHADQGNVSLNGTIIVLNASLANTTSMNATSANATSANTTSANTMSTNTTSNNITSSHDAATHNATTFNATSDHQHLHHHHHDEHHHAYHHPVVNTTQVSHTTVSNITVINATLSNITISNATFTNTTLITTILTYTTTTGNTSESDRNLTDADHHRNHDQQHHHDTNTHNDTQANATMHGNSSDGNTLPPVQYNIQYIPPAVKNKNTTTAGGKTLLSVIGYDTDELMIDAADVTTTFVRKLSSARAPIISANVSEPWFSQDNVTVFDWTALGLVSPVQSQGTNCASDWVFTAVGAIETANAIQQRQRTHDSLVGVDCKTLNSTKPANPCPLTIESISVQHVIDCIIDRKINICAGNTPINILSLFNNNNNQQIIKTIEDKYYPYISGNGQAPYSCNKRQESKYAHNHAVIINAKRVILSERMTVQDIINIYTQGSGVLIICLDARSSLFQQYRGGIYSPTTNNTCATNANVSPNYCMLSTGYGYVGDHVTNDNMFLVLKSSLGTSWGMNGYMYHQVRAGETTCSPLQHAIYVSAVGSVNVNQGKTRK